MLTLQEKKVRLASAVLLFKYAHSGAAEVLRSAFFFSLVILMGIFWKKSKGNTDKELRDGSPLMEYFTPWHFR